MITKIQLALDVARQHVGAVGTGVTGGAGFIGWVAKAVPVLQAVSLTVSIIVGVLTGVWYIRKFLRGE